MHVDSHSGILRVFYATLSLVTTKLPVLNMVIPSFNDTLKNAVDEEKKESLDTMDKSSIDKTADEEKETEKLIDTVDKISI